jgi:ABC-type transport system involved in multi-copper enzyme maturation permease subunit
MGWLLITRFTIQEAIRRRLFLTMAILTLLMLILFGLLVQAAASRMQENNIINGRDPALPTLYAGIAITILAMWLVYLVISTMTIFLTISMISGEVEAGTFVVIVPKPLRRAEIIFGKWLGYALFLGLYTLLLSLAFMGIIYRFTGYWPTQAFAAIGMLEMSMLVLLGLITLCGAFVPTAANGAIAVMLFMGAFISSIVQFAIPAQDSMIQNITAVISLIMPTDAMWHGASFYLFPAAIGVLQDFTVSSINTPITATQPISTALLTWGILYSLVLPLIAMVRFQHRDL